MNNKLSLTQQKYIWWLFRQWWYLDLLSETGDDKYSELSDRCDNKLECLDVKHSVGTPEDWDILTLEESNAAFKIARSAYNNETSQYDLFKDFDDFTEVLYK